MYRLFLSGIVFLTTAITWAGELPQEVNTWVKRSPLKEAPPSPGLSYETSLGYDPVARRVIRWGGHAQGGVKGSGEQIAEVWTLDPATMQWEHKEPNRSPPATCCAQQNVFDLLQNRFLRFRGAGGNHGWQWFREIYLNNSSVWNYDLPTNTWRDMRPVPEPSVGIMRCASWDSDYQVAVVFGGEGRREGTVVFDPYTNTWTRMHPKNEPALGSKEPRSGGNMAYDAARKLHVLFGSQFFDDRHTWAYDLKKNEWFDQKPATQPPTNRNDAVLAYDSVNRVIVAIVRVADAVDGNEVLKAHLETWVYDAGKNLWTHPRVKREPDATGGRSRVMTFVPDQNLVLVDAYLRPTERASKVEREHQIWTYRHAEARPNPAPLPPREVRLATTGNGAILEWRPSVSPEVTGYAIYRGEGAEPWRADLKQVARVERSRTRFQDDGLPSGTLYHYVVRALDQTKESGDSERVRTQPRVVEDAVVSVISPKEIALTWKPPLGFTDIVGYHVERADVEVFSDDEILRVKKDTPPLPEPSVGAVRHIGKFSRLTEKPLKEARFVDTAVDLHKRTTVDAPLLRGNFQSSQLDAAGKPYRLGVHAYRIRAVNALGIESGPSPYFLTIPSAPQHVFSREEAGQCHLKWAANPEQGVTGYRVYWMKGPRPEGPGQAVHRLTKIPVKETRFTDIEAGMDPRRYWIVAVDALGQEGIPSSPAWHYRTQRKFYVPFVGEWHQ